jgi:hypothetical protein
MASSSVLRLGPSGENVSATLLRNALVSYFEQKEKESSPSTPRTSAIDDKSGSTFTISNKYFNASVLLEEIGGSAAAAAAAAPLEEEGDTTTTTTTTTKEDGVILVFDALHSNPDRSTAMSGRGGATSFDSLSSAHQQAEDMDTCGDLLRLCVGVSLTSLSPEELRGKANEKEYARRILWCLDRGYEYVEADLSQEGQSKGHTDRDKEGFARIVEAIQGTVWSSAVMIENRTKELKASYQEESVALEKEEKPEEEENRYEPPDPSKWGPQPTMEESLAQKLLDTSSNSESGLFLDSEEKVGPEEMEQLRKNLEVEQVFDKMEGVLREATRIREASKSGTLTDDQRRDRAGDAAMALVNLMGDFGFDDADSGTEGDSSVDSGIAEN